MSPEEQGGLPPPNRPDGNPHGWGCGDVTTDGMVPDSFWKTDFTPGCRRHDACYETCGMPKATCDNNFLKDLLSQCSISGGGAVCRTVARGYYKAMQTETSKKAYDAAQKKACENCK